MTPAPTVHLVARPRALPAPPRVGRCVVIDVAFAQHDDFGRVTWPFVQAMGPRLALWIDHHDHPAWRELEGDGRFVLASKLRARACPQLITPELVARAGSVQHVLAHADFDGCMAAAKFLRGGVAPYAEADEDARFADAPGHGFACSPAGLQVVQALEQSQATEPSAAYLRLAGDILAAWRDGVTPAALRERLAGLAQQYARRAAALDTQLRRAVAPASQCLLVEISPSTPTADKKYLLRQLEARARVGMLWDGAWVTLATFDDEGPAGLDLSALPRMKGQRGYAWGKAALPSTLVALAAALREAQ